MPEAEIQISVRMADRGEPGFRAISASVSGTEGTVKDAPVHWVIAEGPGTIGMTGGPERILPTDEWGLAEINWYPVQQARTSPEAQVPQVARLVARCDDPRARSLTLAVTGSGWSL